MKVSVVIPSFKRADYLDRLLESINEQTFQNFEVIVVDDCSPNQDDYKIVVNKYKNIFNEFTFLVNEKNSGAPHSRNRGIRLAKYELIALVDDDDEWFPEKLEKQVQIFLEEKENSKLGIVYTWAKVIDNDKNLLDTNESKVRGNGLKDILEKCFICSPSVMVKKDSIVKTGLFDEDLPSCQDWDMWTRMFKAGFECDVVKEFLTYYYKHDGPTIGTSPRARVGFLKYYKKHFVSLFLHFKWKHLYRYFRWSISG